MGVGKIRKVRGKSVESPWKAMLHGKLQGKLIFQGMYINVHYLFYIFR